VNKHENPCQATQAEANGKNNMEIKNPVDSEARTVAFHSDSIETGSYFALKTAVGSFILRSSQKTHKGNISR